ncbi:MAG: hypothetical protein NTU44_20135, partial [Bacteroidetes bacterium]|nr:hypothetical protein [Bacteroidota bacterium]
TVYFEGPGPSNIFTPETFYNLCLNKDYTDYDGLEVMPGISVAVINNTNLSYGTLEMDDNSSLILNNLTIYYDAGLNANDPNTTVKLSGNWADYNYGHTMLTGYDFGASSTVVFNGSSDQDLTCWSSIGEFWNVTIDKPSGILMNNGDLEFYGNFYLLNGAFQDNSYGLNRYFHGNFTAADNTGWYALNGNVYFNGGSDQELYLNPVAGYFYHFNVDKSNGSVLWMTSDVHVLNIGTVNVNNGTINLNGNFLRTSGFININSSGKMTVPGGSRLEVNETGGVTVFNGGILELLGTAENKALLSHVHWDASYYPFAVESGGTLSAENAVFEYMDYNGINLLDGAIIDSLHPLKNCAFWEGQPGGVLITANSGQNITVDSSFFPENTWGSAYNVRNTSNTGQMLFINYIGDFAGEPYDDDIYNRVNWLGGLAVVASVDDPVLCQGQSTTIHAVATGGTGIYSYTWSSLPSGFNANVPSLLVTPIVSLDYIIAVSDGYQTVTDTVHVTLNPAPVVNPVSNISVCRLSYTPAINFTASVPGTTFNWTNSNDFIGLPEDGTGNIPSFEALNGGNTTLVATIIVTPTANGCTGAPMIFTITVYPTANFAVPLDVMFCNGALIGPTNLIGMVPGTTFTWTNNNTSIGLSASGVGNVPSFIANNTGSTFQVAHITITPWANGCAGQVRTYSITVFPLPQADAGPDVTITAGYSTTLNGNGSGTEPPYIYYWTPEFWLNNPVAQNPVATPPETMDFILIVSDVNGCHGRDTVTVNVVTGTNELNGILTYDNSAHTPLNNATVELLQGGSVINTSLTGFTGFYGFTSIPAGTYTLDATCPKPLGGVNAADALLAMKHFVGITYLTGVRLKAADVDGTGYVNTVDALIIMKRFVGILDSFVVGDWAFETPTVTMAPTGILTQNFKGICSGDLDGSYTPAAKNESYLSLQESGQLVVGQQQLVTIPFTLDNPDRVGAMSLVFNIDQNVARVTDVKVEQEGTLVYHMLGNELRIAWYSLNPSFLKTGESLFSLTLALEPSVSSALLSDNQWISSTYESQLADENAHLLPDKVLTYPKLVMASDEFFLGQNVPNPFIQNAEISYYLPENGRVILKMTDVLGKEVRTLVDETQPSGTLVFKLVTGNLPAGVYSYKIEVKGETRYFTQTRQMVISR